MNSHHDSDQLGQRIRALVDHHVPDEVRAGHLAAIDAELAHQPQTASDEPTIWSAARWRARRWLAGLAAAATVLTPGIAVAAHDAVPGDTLYSVKRATEHLHRLVTPDVAARNRVAELAALLDRDTSPDILAAASDAARDAVAALPNGHPLHDELAALLARIPNQPGGDAAPPPPTNTADDEREHDGRGGKDHSEPDDRDEPAGHHDDTDHTDEDTEDTDDLEDGDDLHNDTDHTDEDTEDTDEDTEDTNDLEDGDDLHNDTNHTNDIEDGDELDDEADEPDQGIDEPDNDTDDGHEPQDAISAEDDDGSDQDD